MQNEQVVKFAFLINGKEAHTSDRTPDSLQLLADAAYEPADDYVLIQRTAHGSRVVSTDDEIDLETQKVEFYAFPTGATFEVTVNTHSVWWGEPSIDLGKIRRLANVGEDEDLFWIREGKGNEKLALDGEFRLDRVGVEHLRTHKREVPPVAYVYFVESVEYTTEHASLTGAQITARVPDWNPVNSLVLESEDSAKDELIHPTTVVEFKGRTTPAHFAIVPPATFGRV
ncbi:multiubiquitin domain-containing protein [Paraburkholderia phenazinium]|uniref:multiubiquitin domain-containing protein n=1 Tax=Paraburkholderia phenazinium TaxID=60549 RepID=UPI00158C74C5|nr:multiubiquitin domain-containing protein [Paraburkholderia phenazinium]